MIANIHMETDVIAQKASARRAPYGPMLRTPLIKG
jgi:hypothetical protein